MTLSALIQKRSTAKIATAIPAIPATQPNVKAATVAKIATVAVANLSIEAMQYAPEQFKNLVHDTAVEMGLMPATPDAYSDDGEPLYFLEGIADRLGITPADIPDRFKELSHTGAIHRTH